MHNISIGLVTNPDLVESVSRFFCDNISTDYISHGDIIDDRALDSHTWDKDVMATFRSEALEAINQSIAAMDDGLHLCAAWEERDQLCGIMLYEIVTGIKSKSLLLHDIIVANKSRGRGIGVALLQWLESEASQISGIRRIVIESGLQNERAHHFFEQHGFAQTSIVMMKQLPDTFSTPIDDL